MKRRIWELDAFRGLFLIGMIGIHLIYDLVDLFGVLPWNLPEWYLLFKNNYGLLFLVLSGICVTLGSHSVKRGVQVFLCGMVVTLVTVGMLHLRLAHRSIVIYFGVLHCLGVCMLLWGLFRHFPNWLLGILGVAMVAAGLYLRYSNIVVFSRLLLPLGFVYRGFASSDYFPLLPNLGYFLIGAVIGRTVYKKKESLLPETLRDNRVTLFLEAMGRNSLLIYMLHQPVLAAIVGLISLAM